MKKIILSSLIVLITVSVFAQQYVDLGLESGTLWKDRNEDGFYTYQEAEKAFGNGIPTAPQLNELLNACTWEWTDKGYKITGPNGKSIFLSTDGYYSCDANPTIKGVGESGQYWSKTVSDNSSIAFPEWKFPYCLSITAKSKDVHFNNPDCCKFSVCLVKEDERAVLIAELRSQLADGKERSKTDAEEQKRQKEEQTKQEEQKKIEAEAKQKAMMEDKRLEAECISVKDIDGNQYALVMIGNQCWMRENLRTTRYANGTKIATGGKNLSYKTRYKYCPNGNANNVPTYGYLYNWAAVMCGGASSNGVPSTVQGVCPDGWHVPSDAEISILLDYVASQPQYQCDSNPQKTAKALASTTGWKESKKKFTPGNNSQENNATGFSAMPAGTIHLYNTAPVPGDASDFSFEQFGEYAFFWTATEYNSTYAFMRMLWYNEARGNLPLGKIKWDRKERAISVRCVRGAGVLGNMAGDSHSGSTENNQNSATPQSAGTQNAWLILGAPYKSPTYNLNPLMTPYLYPELYAAPSSSSSESSSIPLQSAVSHYVPIGTATGIKITESGSYTSITCPVESWNGSGPPSAVIDGEHYTLVRSSSSTCSGVNVSQYKYVGFITNVLGVAYTIYVNF